MLNCITDKSGKYLSKDDFALYVSKEDTDYKKKKFAVSAEAKAAIKQYYQSAQELCEVQTAFMQSTQELESKIADKEIFLDIIKQVQLPTAQVNIRMREAEETLEGKISADTGTTQHLPNYRTIHPSATDQSRTMAAFMYYVLHEQITGKQKSQMGCSMEFHCRTTPFKHLVTGKKQPGGQGRVSKSGKSSRKLEDVVTMEDETAAKKPKPAIGK